MKKLLHLSLTLLFYVTAIVASALVVGFASAANGQEPSTTYRGTSRDPFVKYKAPVRRAPGVKKPAKPVAPLPVAVAVPDLKERIERYKALKVQAMNAQQPAPKPVTALLLSEVQITGIFRTPRGYAAMIEATPIKLSYVIYPGEMFYDGQLVAVEENRLVFRRETRYTNGKREMVVENKPLRLPTAVTNEMNPTKTVRGSETDGTSSSAVANAERASAGTGNPK